MPRITCPGCNKTFDVPVDLSGKVIRCKTCKQKMQVPVAKVRIPVAQPNVFDADQPTVVATPTTMPITETKPQIVYIEKPPAPVVIEQTSKEWKAMILLGGFMIYLSPAGCVIGAAATRQPNPTFNLAFLAVFFIGVGVYMFGKIGAYWNHG